MEAVLNTTYNALLSDTINVVLMQYEIIHRMHF